VHFATWVEDANEILQRPRPSRKLAQNKLFYPVMSYAPVEFLFMQYTSSPATRALAFLAFTGLFALPSQADLAVIDWWSGSMAYNPYNVSSAQGFELGGMSNFGDGEIWQGLNPEEHWVQFEVRGETVTTSGPPIMVDDFFDPLMLDHSAFTVDGSWNIVFGSHNADGHGRIDGTFSLEGRWEAPPLGPPWHPTAYMTATLWADPGVTGPMKESVSIDLSQWLLSLEAVSSMDGPIVFGDIYASTAMGAGEVVPEPATIVILGTGVGLVAWRARRRVC
jgi:hypothetical protein